MEKTSKLSDVGGINNQTDYLKLYEVLIKIGNSMRLTQIFLTADYFCQSYRACLKVCNFDIQTKGGGGGFNNSSIIHY